MLQAMFTGRMLKTLKKKQTNQTKLDIGVDWIQAYTGDDQIDVDWHTTMYRLANIISRYSFNLAMICNLGCWCTFGWANSRMTFKSGLSYEPNTKYRPKICLPYSCYLALCALCYMWGRAYFQCISTLKNSGFRAIKRLFSVLLRLARHPLRTMGTVVTIPHYAGIKRQTTVMCRTRPCPTPSWPLCWTCLTINPLGLDQSTPVINKTLEKGFRWLPSTMSTGWISAAAVLSSSQSCNPTKVKWLWTIQRGSSWSLKSTKTLKWAMWWM